MAEAGACKHCSPQASVHHITPWSKVLQKLTGPKPVKKFPAFYRTQKFITTFRRPHHLSLSWARSTQSMSPIPYPEIYLNITLPSASGSSKLLFPSGFPTKTLYTLLPKHAECPAYLIPLDLITRTILGEEYRSLSSSLCSFLHFHLTWSLLGPHILLSSLFSNTLTLWSCLIVSNQVSHPYKTTGVIIAL